MAGEWIKMRNDLAEDPAVISMAARFGVDEDMIVGKLHRLWSWADRQSRDGHAAGVTNVWIDRYIRLDGFAEAMVEVRWLAIDETGITFPNFDRHNGETAKSRALGAKRKQKQRTNVPQTVPDMSRTERDKNGTREEKRREESKSIPPTPADAVAPVGKAKKKSERMTFASFVQACRDKGDKPIQPADPIFTFADDTQIPREFIALAWRAFSAKHREGRKQQAGITGWRAHFRDAVRGNWGKVWYFGNEGGEASLTTVGIALKREMEASLARKAAEQSDAEAAA